MTARPLISPFVGWLAFTCSKCTRTERFAGKNRTEAATQAKAKGWAMPEEDRFNCPSCSKVFGVRGAA
jgi:hypothetical protein